MRKRKPHASNTRWVQAKRLFRDDRGDVYFESLICLFLFITALAISLQVLSAVQLKFWLDGMTSAIIRNVQINGHITDHADAMVNEVTDRLGTGTIVEWDANFIGSTGRIQLGEMIRIRIKGETTLFRIGTVEGIKIAVASESVGTSEIYWKDS